MSQQLKRLLVAVVAMGALLAMPTGAMAEEEEIVALEPGGDGEMTSLGNLTFSGRGFIEINVECALSLGGDVVETFSNTADAFVASVESGTAECEGATARLLVNAELPWSLLLREAIELAGDSSLAPLKLELAEIEFDVIGIDCLYQGEISISLPASGDPLSTGLATVTEGSVTKVTGGAFCPTTGTLSGALAFAPAQQMRGSTRKLTPDRLYVDHGTSSGTRDIVWTNRSNVDQRVWNSFLVQGNNWHRIVANDCKGTERAAKVLKDVDVQPEQSRCTIRVEYIRPTPPPGMIIIHPYMDWIRIEGDPAVITPLSVVQVRGR
jgi:hypothetical protein